METARILSENRSIAVQADPRLRQRRFGSWEGSASSEYDVSVNQKGLNLESDRSVQRRVLHFLQEKADLYPQSTILVVTHSGIIRNLLAVYLGISPDDIHVKNVALVQLKVFHEKIEVQELQGIEFNR
jgi:broad specificity phosphatase PhoE